MRYRITLQFSGSEIVEGLLLEGEYLKSVIDETVVALATHLIGQGLNAEVEDWSVELINE